MERNRIRGRLFVAVLALAAAWPLAATAREVPFAPESIVTAAADAVGWASFADVDRDGDLDVVADSFSRDDVVWYENTGGVWTKHSITTAADGLLALWTADLDGDGDADPDPKCVDRPWKNKEIASGCGIGVEIALLMPLLAGWHARARRRGVLQTLCTAKDCKR